MMISLPPSTTLSLPYLHHAFIPLAAASVPLLYALSACLFLAGWREASLRGLLARPTCLRAYALWVAALAGTVARRRRCDNDDEAEAGRSIFLLDLLALALSSLGFAVASLWMCRQVRTALVEGGPPPGPSVFLDEESSIIMSSGSSKVVVITGCNQGIGKETLRLLFAPSESTLTESSSSSASSSSSTPPPTTQANGGSSSKPYKARRPRHTVILCCRSVDKARQAAVDVGLLLPVLDGGDDKEEATTPATTNGDQQQQHRISNNGAAHARTDTSLPNVKVELVELDLSDLEQVRVAAGRIMASHPVVHVLINNAGLMMDRQQFADQQQQQQRKGKDQEDSSAPYELVMTANHLGHFLLTRLLRPAECIVNVSSCTYALSDPNFLDDLFCTRGTRNYTMFGQYAASKAANLLFTAELSRRVVQKEGRWRRKRSEKSASQQPAASEDEQEERQCQYPACHAVHPGMVRTNVVRNMPWYLRIPNDLLGFAVSPFQKTPEQGAWNTVHAINATYRNRNPSPKEQSTSSSSPWTYWVNRRPSDVLPWIHDEDTARRLWEMSSDLVDLPYDYYDDTKECHDDN
jgi:NAD(P)-dependent dehydrogenase (short-subunit alcohol dehydrogenase family)